jgi:hypothetical protein
MIGNFNTLDVQVPQREMATAPPPMRSTRRAIIFLFSEN